MENDDLKPSLSISLRRIRTQDEWNVLTHMIRARLPTRASTRTFISAAALLVNVIARMEPGWAFRSLTSHAIRRVSTRVLPEPAPATTSSGAPSWTTAARWGSLSPSSSSSLLGPRRDGGGSAEAARCSKPGSGADVLMSSQPYGAAPTAPTPLGGVGRGLGGREPPHPRTAPLLLAALLRSGSDDEHGAGGVVLDALGGAADQDRVTDAATSGGHHDQPGAGLGRRLDDLVGG